MFALLYNKMPHLLSPLFRNVYDVRFLEGTTFIINRSLSSTFSDQNQLKETSFTVSYLSNSCGLSLEEANSASKKVQLKTLERPDSVLALFKRHGFSDSQITKIVKAIPNILTRDADENLLPMFKFFSSIGITGPHLVEFISSTPLVFKKGLSTRIIPLYEFLKNTQGFDDYTAIKAMIYASKFYISDVAIISANLSFSREVGMPESVIKSLVMYHFNLLSFGVDNFRNKIKKVIDMGFCPTERKFLYALSVVLCYSESTLQHKFEIYGRCGWSKDETISSFKRHPQCMTFSEKKIIHCMNFLVNVMDMKPSAVASNPSIFHYSLKKRTIPRGLVVKLLVLKGLLTNDISFCSVLQKADEWFLQEYVEKYKEQIPCLVGVFEGRISPQDLGFSI